MPIYRAVRDLDQSSFSLSSSAAFMDMVTSAESVKEGNARAGPLGDDVSVGKASNWEVVSKEGALVARSAALAEA